MAGSRQTSRLRPQAITLLFLCAAALVLRFSYLRATTVVAPLRADALEYATYGYNLARHATFSLDPASSVPIPDSYRPPGYPLFIALCFLVAGDHGYYKAVLYSQAVLDSLTVAAAFLLGCLVLPSWAALIPAVLVAFCPHLVVMTGYVLRETLLCFLLAWSLVAFFKAVTTNTKPWFIASGVLFGYACLTAPQVFFLPYFLAGGAWAGMRHKKISPVPLLVFVLVFSLFPAAWKAREQLSLPTNAPREKQLALHVLASGTYVDFVYKDKNFRGHAYDEDPEYPRMSGSWSGLFEVLGKRFAQNPARLLAWYVLQKPFWLWNARIVVGAGDVFIYEVAWSLYDVSRLARLTKDLMQMVHPLILVLALLGAVLALASRQGRPLMLFLVLFYFTALYALFVSEPRYSIPLRPVLYVFSVWALLRLLSLLSLRANIPEKQAVFLAWGLAGAICLIVCVGVVLETQTAPGSHRQPVSPELAETDVLAANYYFNAARGAQALAMGRREEASACMRKAMVLLKRMGHGAAVKAPAPPASGFGGKP